MNQNHRENRDASSVVSTRSSSVIVPRANSIVPRRLSSSLVPRRPSWFVIRRRRRCVDARAHAHTPRVMTRHESPPSIPARLHRTRRPRARNLTKYEYIRIRTTVYETHGLLTPLHIKTHIQYTPHTRIPPLNTQNKHTHTQRHPED